MNCTRDAQYTSVNSSSSARKINQNAIPFSEQLYNETQRITRVGKKPSWTMIFSLEHSLEVRESKSRPAIWGTRRENYRSCEYCGNYVMTVTKMLETKAKEVTIFTSTLMQAETTMRKTNNSSQTWKNENSNCGIEYSLTMENCTKSRVISLKQPSLKQHTRFHE